MSAPDDLCLALDGLRRGPQAAALAPAWLWIRGGQVEYLAGAPPPELSEHTVRLYGGWAVEPLADAHVHLFLDGSRDPAGRARTAALPRAAALERALSVLRRYRSLGIAAVRDAGDPHGLALEAARHANARPDRFAAVLPAGEPVYRRGRYGGFLGAGVESATDAAALLVRNRDAGATHAKVLATGLNSLDRAGAAGPPQFCRDELAEIAAAATSLGLPLMVHANGPLGDVIAARPASVEHGFGCTAADRLRLGEPGISWVPTLGAWAELAGPPQLPPKQAAVVAATDREQRHAVAHGHRAGVALAAGSDAGCPGVPHGQGLLREIGRLAHAGLPPAAALATASAAARELCQRELGRPLGGLSPGGPAGFVWLAGDPVAAPATLDAPLGVYLGGCWSPAPAPPPHREA